MTRSSVSGNSAENGGGIMGSQLQLSESTISGNTALVVGGIYQIGVEQEGILTKSTLTNSTVSGNRGDLVVGGIRVQGTMTITNSTISGNVGANSAGGLQNLLGFATVVNTIISGNTAPTGPQSGPDCASHDGFRETFFSQGHNLIGNDAGCNFIPAQSDLVNVDPLLGPLADNGGPTLTHALLSDSPAIDAGDDGAAPATDQRGVSRPGDGDGDGTATSDIGAFELGPSPPPDTDGDGIPDEEDECPLEFGDPEFGGCPTPPLPPPPSTPVVTTETAVLVDGECFVTTQKELEGPVAGRGRSGLDEEAAREIEIIKVISACADRHPRPGGSDTKDGHDNGEHNNGRHRGPFSHVHTRVETFIVQCVKGLDLSFAECLTHRGRIERPSVHDGGPVD